MPKQMSLLRLGWLLRPESATVARSRVAKAVVVVDRTASMEAAHTLVEVKGA